MIKRLLLNIILHTIRCCDYNILMLADKDKSVIYCFCCEEHLRVGCAEILNCSNINHLTLNEETGRNNERGIV